MVRQVAAALLWLAKQLTAWSRCFSPPQTPAASMAEALSILERVSSEFDMVIAARAVYEPAAYNKNLHRKFDNSFAAHAFMVVRAQLLFGGIGALMRMWDKPMKDMQSIPCLLLMLKNAALQNEFLSARRQEWLVGSEDPGSEPELREYLKKRAEEWSNAYPERMARLISDIEAISTDPVVQGLRNFRHKALAHSLSQTYAEVKAMRKGRKMVAARHGDFEGAVDKTMPIVFELRSLLRGSSTQPQADLRLWEKYADDFWLAIAAPPSRRPRPKIASAE